MPPNTSICGLVRHPKSEILYRLSYILNQKNRTNQPCLKRVPERVLPRQKAVERPEHFLQGRAVVGAAFCLFLVGAEGGNGVVAWRLPLAQPAHFYIALAFFFQFPAGADVVEIPVEVYFQQDRGVDPDSYRDGAPFCLACMCWNPKVFRSSMSTKASMMRTGFSGATPFRGQGAGSSRLPKLI